MDREEEEEEEGFGAMSNRWRNASIERHQQLQRKPGFQVWRLETCNHAEVSANAVSVL